MLGLGLGVVHNRAKVTSLVPFRADLDGLYDSVSGLSFIDSIAANNGAFLPRVAEFNGTDDYITLGTEITGKALELYIDIKDYLHIGSTYGIFGGSAAGSYISTASVTTLRIKIGGVTLDYTIPSVVTTPDFTLRVVIRSLVSVTYCKVYFNGVESVSGEQNTSADSIMSITNIGVLPSFSTMTGKVKETYIKNTTTDAYLVYMYPQGSGNYEYDLSASANHGTWAGTGDRYDYDANGSTYSKTNGYSLWQKAASVDIQVPFSLAGAAISLTAGTNIPAGYTKTVDIVGSASTWNMADALVDFDPTDGAAAALDLLDRSNVTRQTAASRASLYYDSGNVYRYHISEMADFSVLDTFFESAYQDRLFAHVKYSAAEIIELLEVLSYATAKTGADLTSVKSYCNIP